MLKIKSLIYKICLTILLLPTISLALVSFIILDPSNPITASAYATDGALGPAEQQQAQATNPSTPTASGSSKQAACAGLNALDSSTASDCSNLDKQGGGFTSTVSTVVTILSWVVGIVSIVMVLVAALKYITSGGDANKVGAAKSALIYAMIGLAIAGAAQALVHFVLSSANNALPTN